MRQRLLIALIPLILLLAVPGKAGHWDKFLRLCPEELVDLTQILVPVGCEAVDCCPGCPGPPDVLEWRILVERGLTRSVEVTFEGLDERALAGLQLRGNVTRQGKSLLVGPGESFIGGLPNARKGKVAVAMVKVTPDKEQVRKVSAAAGDNDADGAAGQAGGVEIQQLSGRFVVNRFRARYQLIPCGGGNPPLVEDVIRLSGNTGSDNAVILADYRKGGTCRDDVVHRATTQRGIGNATTNGGCNSEVSVFSDDNAMSFQTNVTTWTNTAGDVHNVNLQPILVAPITVWIAMAGATARAQNDVANANLLYNRNNVGVQFNATFTDVSANQNAVNTIGGAAGDCATAGALGGTAFFTAGRINIYYVNGAFTGVNCAANRNISFIGTTANIASLPHEIGHAYALRPSASGGHTNGLAGFGNDNIMFGGGPATRDQFSVGQAFRINVSDISQLNLNGTRAGTTRTCAPLTVSNLCPALALDATPH
ncbi:MAG TPA: hypothetical protein VJ276_06075 [Thermoanaerobaculia bacterium]|nr:hypothetical protein [Thermoanaerobaculia bacterium]